MVHPGVGCLWAHGAAFDETPNAVRIPVVDQPAVATRWSNHPRALAGDSKLRRLRNREEASQRKSRACDATL